MWSKSLVSDDWENSIRKRVVKVEQRDRSQLVGLARTVRRMRKCLVERERGRRGLIPCLRWPAPY